MEAKRISGKPAKTKREFIGLLPNMYDRATGTLCVEWKAVDDIITSPDPEPEPDMIQVTMTEAEAHYFSETFTNGAFSDNPVQKVGEAIRRMNRGG